MSYSYKILTFFSKVFYSLKWICLFGSYSGSNSLLYFLNITANFYAKRLFPRYNLDHHITVSSSFTCQSDQQLLGWPWTISHVWSLFVYIPQCFQRRWPTCFQCSSVQTHLVLQWHSLTRIGQRTCGTVCPKEQGSVSRCLRILCSAMWISGSLCSTLNPSFTKCPWTRHYSSHTAKYDLQCLIIEHCMCKVHA